MTRMTDVAAAAGVSVATVSRVLNGVVVRPESEAAVQAAIAKLGYAPNRVARTLRRQRSEVIGLIVADIENPFFTAFARVVEDRAQARQLSVVLCNSDEDQSKEAQYLQVAMDEHMSGVILFPASPRTQVQPLIDRGIAVVAVDRALDQAIDSVCFDNVTLGLDATLRLIDRGARRVACITGPRQLSTAAERAEGWRQALIQRGLPVEDALLVHADFRVDGGRAAAAALCDLPEPPDAFLATNNFAGVGVLQELSCRNDAVTAVGVIGQLPFVTSLARPVQVTPLPTTELGERAWELLVGRILGDRTSPAESIVVPVPAPRDLA